MGVSPFAQKNIERNNDAHWQPVGGSRAIILADCARSDHPCDAIGQLISLHNGGLKEHLQPEFGLDFHRIIMV